MFTLPGFQPYSYYLCPSLLSKNVLTRPTDTSCLRFSCHSIVLVVIQNNWWNPDHSIQLHSWSDVACSSCMPLRFLMSPIQTEMCNRGTCVDGQRGKRMLGRLWVRTAGAKSRAEANFPTWFLFRSRANCYKWFTRDLMNNRKAHQNGKGTGGGGGGRGTKSNLLRMLPDWNRPHTRSNSPNKTRFPLNRQLWTAFSPAWEQGKNRTRSPGVNKTREAPVGLHFSFAVSPPCCSEWLLCIVESYWLVSPSAHPGSLHTLVTALRDACE